jgi:multidrug transporter EmrE-like cation transporter
MTLTLGITFALLCALASNLAFLYKHRGARSAVKVDIRHPLRTAVSLWSQKWFAIGMLIGGGAWVLHVAAIALAPLSVVQAVLSGGIVLLAVMADKLFGFSVGKRQWWGLGCIAVGLILLGVTMPDANGAHAQYSLPTMIAFEAGLLSVGVLLTMGTRIPGSHAHHGIMYAAAAGILFGVCNVGIKALTGVVADGGVLALLLSPWLLTSLIASVGAFYASARSLQDGDAVPVITITGTATTICVIAGGILVFGDPMPGTALGIVVQAFAFLLVVVASALTPAPVRAATRAASPAGAPA